MDNAERKGAREASYLPERVIALERRLAKVEMVFGTAAIWFDYVAKDNRRHWVAAAQGPGRGGLMAEEWKKRRRPLSTGFRYALPDEQN